MRRKAILAATSTVVVIAATGLSSTSANAGPPSPLDGYSKLVVIYEENHSFDNLYGLWGKVGNQKVNGLSHAEAGTTQVDQSGTPIGCLLQNDANLVPTTATVKWLDGSTHPGLLSPECSSTTPNGVAFDSHFTSSAPFSINDYIAPADKTCPPPTVFAANGVEKGDPQGQPGGCTRDIVHRFYQEQYQLDGGRQDRYSTGSDAAGLTQGHYDTTQLPVYQYLHAAGAPNYVIADNFFQAAFGGSFLNHQYLVAAQAPRWDTSQSAVPAGKNSVLDAAGFPNKTYPLYKPDPAVAYNDGPLTQACGQPTTVQGFACGNSAVNTMQPSWQPSAFGANVLPGVNDVDPSKPFYETNIGDELSAKNVSWNWYAGGWNNAVAGHPDPLFQFHHQPLNYFQNYAPGMSGRRTCGTKPSSSPPQRRALCPPSRSSSRSAKRTSTPATPAPTTVIAIWSTCSNPFSTAQTARRRSSWLRMTSSVANGITSRRPGRVPRRPTGHTISTALGRASRP